MHKEYLLIYTRALTHLPFFSRFVQNLWSIYFSFKPNCDFETFNDIIIIQHKVTAVQHNCHLLKITVKIKRILMQKYFVFKPVELVATVIDFKDNKENLFHCS